MSQPTKPQVDVAATRASRNYSWREKLLRLLWALSEPAFSWSPRPCFAWRRAVLRLFGARIGRDVNAYPSTRITLPWNLTVGDWSSLGEEVLVYNLGPVTIGSRVTVSLGAVLCAGSHDHTRADFPLLKPPIILGDDAWICAQAFVGPGVTVGSGAVLAARAVAARDVPAWTIVAGNPATEIGRRHLEGSDAVGGRAFAPAAGSVK